MTVLPSRNRWAIYNVMVYLRFLSAPFLIWLSALFVSSHDQTLALILLVATSVLMGLDYYDGKLARAADDVTEWGQWADPLADKIVTTILLATIAFSAPNVLIISSVVVLIFRDAVMTWARRRRRLYGQSPLPASVWGKRKTLWQTLAILLFLCAAITPAGVNALTIPVIAYTIALLAACAYSLLSMKLYLVTDQVE